MLGMLLGDIANLRPLANTDFCAGVNSFLNKFMTHLIYIYLYPFDYWCLTHLH